MSPLERCYLGLVLGETLSWARVFERSNLLPYWTRRKRREIEAQHDQAQILDQVQPFALNQPIAPLRAGPGALAEWFYFQFLIFDHTRDDYVLKDAVTAWRDLAAQRSTLRLTLAEHSSIVNLQRGATPPTTGYQNPHYFDTSSTTRALALACLLTEPRLQNAVRQDASITNAEDGIDVSVAVSVLARALIDGYALSEARARAWVTLPEGTWGHRLSHEACDATREATDIYAVVRGLEEVAGNYAYCYGTSAPEALAVTMALLQYVSRTDIIRNSEEVLFAALALPRTAHAAIPLLAALLGLAGSIPDAALRAYHDTPLAGVALPMLRGFQPTREFKDMSNSKVKPWQTH